MQKNPFLLYFLEALQDIEIISIKNGRSSFERNTRKWILT